MDVKLFKLFFFLGFFCLFSCQESKNSTDYIIQKYDNYNFSQFKNYFIAIRQHNPTETIYMIGDSDGKKPLYFIEYNETTNNININKSVMQKMNVKDYIDDNKLRDLIDNFRKLNFCLISVDSNNNVFLNPDEINKPASLLKTSKEVDLENVKMGIYFKHYKGSWYILKK